MRSRQDAQTENLQKAVQAVLFHPARARLEFLQIIARQPDNQVNFRFDALRGHGLRAAPEFLQRLRPPNQPHRVGMNALQAQFDFIHARFREQAGEPLVNHVRPKFGR